MRADTYLDDINAYMAMRWPQAQRLTEYVRNLWADYCQIEVEDRSHVVRQLINDDDEQFWQRLWELQLGSYLLRLGYKPFSPKIGPDFRFELEGLTVWIEATSPTPRGIPPAWLQFPSGGTGTTYETPNTEMLLRWTSAFENKRSKFESYAAQHIISPGEACVIAINGGQLSGFWQTPHGISQMPWCVEVVFPVGPLQVKFFRGRDETEWGHVERHEIFNKNGADIKLYPFITPECSGISAVVSCVVGCSPDLSLPLYVAHNPLAKVPLPFGALGDTTEEWRAVPLEGSPGNFCLSRVP